MYELSIMTLSPGSSATLCVRDYNEIKSEMKNVDDHFVRRNKLLEMPLIRPKLTWFCKNVLEYIAERLDRGLASESFKAKFACSIENIVRFQRLTTYHLCSALTHKS